MSQTARILRGALVAVTVVALGALVMVLLSGCGGEEAPTPAPVATETPAEATPAPVEPTVEPGAVDDSWERIQAAGRIVVGTSADYPPFESYVAPGQIDGFDIALMDEIGRQLGVQVVYVDYPFDALLAAGQAGQIDIALAAISRTPEREAVIGFSNVYLVSEGAALAQQSADITLTKLEDIAKYRVGVQRNTVYKNQIQTGLVDQGLMPPENLTWYEKAEDAVYELLAGRIELVVMDSQAAQAFAEKEAVKVVGIGGGQQLYAIAMPKEATALKAKIDEVITTLMNEGFIVSLSERYLGTPNVLPTPTPGPTSAPVPPPSCVNNMALVQHLTKETEMKPGQAFTKGWQVRNTGTCPWTTSYRLVFASGAKMAGEPAAAAREVKAGETYDWQVPLVAPVNPGTYEGIWQMVDAQGTPFGERLKVNITVKGGPTPTPKPSQTPSPYVEFKEKDNRYQIKVGESVTLVWSTQNVKEVYFYSQYEDWRQGGVPGNGSSKETPQMTTTYYLKVINRDNTVYIPEIKITVEAAPEKPKITQFSVDPAGQITQGQSVAIRWQVDGKVDSVKLTANGAELSRASKGTITHTPPNVGQWTYHLKAVGPGGTNEDDRAITVVPVVDPITPEPPPPDPVIYAFDVSPNQITVGNCVNVSWSVGGGAASVRILRDGGPYWDPPDLQGQFCDTLDEAREYRYQLLARGADKDVPSAEKWVNVTAAPPQNPLARTHWVVTSIQDGAVPIVPEAPPTISFYDDGRFEGAGACTTYGGTYRAEGDSISISVGASSALQCTCPDVEACMAQDAAFLERLPMATNLSVEGTRLLFLDPGGMRLMELSSLLR